MDNKNPQQSEKFSFINIKNEKQYDIVQFIQRKDEYNNKWDTEIAYVEAGNSQMFVRSTLDFFKNFIPLEAWKSATEEQRNKLKGIAPYKSKG